MKHRRVEDRIDLAMLMTTCICDHRSALIYSDLFGDLAVRVLTTVR